MFKLLHLHPQGFCHGDAEVVGDMHGLTELRIALIDAQQYGRAQVRVMAGDGEGYTTTVRLVDPPRFDREPLPYIDPLIWDAERRRSAELLTLVEQNNQLRAQVQDLIRRERAAREVQ